MSKRVRNRTCTFYVHPRNDHTNEAIAQSLGITPEDRIERHVLCSDGRSYNMYVVSYQELELLERSRLGAQLDFTAWRRFSDETRARRMIKFKSALKKSAARVGKQLEGVRRRRSAASS